MKGKFGASTTGVSLQIIWLRIGSLFFIASLIFLSTPSFAVVRYVDASNVSGTYNGTSWATSFNSFDNAMLAATSGDEIWVAKGTYQLSATCNMKSGVNVYGGFLTTHTDLNQRNWQANPTILRGNGSASVINISNIGAVIFDGFVITNGGGTTGGAMYIYKSSPMISNVIFKENVVKSAFAGSSYVSARGGAVCSEQSSPNMTNVFFIDNQALSHTSSGGAAYGGALFNDASSLTLNKAVFQNNSCGEVANSNASVLGGAVHTRNNAGMAPVTITNAVFISNAAKLGTAIYDYSANTIVTNCTFREIVLGFEMYRIESSKVVVTNSIFHSSRGWALTIRDQISSTVRNCFGYSDTYGSQSPAQSNNIASNGGHPFRDISDPDGTDDIWFTEDDGLRLYNNSPSPVPDLGMTISAPAFPDAVVAAAATDVRGVARPEGTAYDMGAYEGEIIGTIIYVDAANADGVHDGQSWATAFNKLEDALAPSVANDGSPIWVAKGTYSPPAGQSFKMNLFNRIYGGFLNTHTAFSQRDWDNNETILHGNGNRVINNDYTGSGTWMTNLAVLDGFTITGGNATGNGGAINNERASPTLRNLIIRNNSASGHGGGLYQNNSSYPLTIENVTFDNNQATGNGGAIAYLTFLTISIENVIFSNNKAGNFGGAIYNAGGTWTINNSVFFTNNAKTGGAYYSYSLAQTYMANIVFASNTAETGATLYSQTGALMNIANCTFSKNTSDDGELVGFNNSIQNIGKITGTNCVLWGNARLSNQSGTVFTYCITQALKEGAENEAATQSPFVDDSNPAGPDGVWMTSDDGLRLRFGQLPTAINSGKTITTTDLPNAAALTSDITGIPRPTGPRYDKGAYEYISTPARYYVDQANSSGVQDGTSWATALTSVDAALRSLMPGDEVWVAKGDYLPENNKSFKLVEGTKVYGGFLNTHTSLDQRDPATNTTTLRGAGKRVITNEFTVNAPMTSATILDGFTITGGRADGMGGGILNNNASPTLRNLIISSNTAPDDLGGGIALVGSSSLIEHVTIKSNVGDYGGGGIFLDSGVPEINDAVFLNNYAPMGGGGGMLTSTGHKLTNAVFSGNSAAYGGGGYDIEYTIYISEPVTSELVNVVFDQNTASYGGGFYATEAAVKLTNVTFSGNKATEGAGGGMLVESYDPNYVVEAINTVFWGNTDTEGTNPDVTAEVLKLSYSFTQTDQTDKGDGNMIGTTSPFIYAPLAQGNDLKWLTEDDGLRLVAGSPAINSGSNAAVNDIAKDILGKSRINAATVDMGAYEYYPSNNANLSHLLPSLFTLSPTFNADVTEYTGSLTSSYVNVTSTVEESTATIQIRVNDEAFKTVASGALSDDLGLNLGVNNIDVKVTAPDGTTTKTYTMTVTRTTNPLPVTLISFSGKPLAPAGAYLTWVTADEKDFDRFEIQRSADAKNFETVGVVKGSENGSYLSTYHFSDYYNAGAPLQNYYRLKMFDTDGSFNLSRVITVTQAEVPHVVGEFYPNPSVSGKVYIDIAVSEGGLWKMSAVSLSGTESQLSGVVLKPGQNQVALSVSGLHPGINLIRFENAGKVFVRKVIKMD